MAVADTGKVSSNLIRTSVPNLISGVSQQADTFKLSSQAVEQTNAISSVVHGLTKRGGTKFLKNLNFSGLTPIKFFKITISLSEQYLAVLLNNNATNVKSLKIFNLDGTEQSVYEYEAGVSLTSYFANATEDSVKTLTIADYTFLLNSNKQVAVLNSLTPRALAGSTQVYQGMIVVKQGYSGKSTQSPSGLVSFSIKLVDKTTGATYGTFTGNSDSFADTSPRAIANTIYAGLSLTQNTSFSLGNYRIFAEGSNVYIQHESVDFDIVVDDGYAGTLFYAVKDSIQNFDDLPVIAPHKFVTKIAGFPEQEGDEYYVQHISTQSSIFSQGSSASVPKGVQGISEGYWEECVAPGITYKLDPATMPHTLIKIAAGKFLFTPVNGDNSKSYGGTAFTEAQTWGDRVVGDEETNPWPSFVPNTIENMFFYKNRLGILSGENVIFSEAGEFFNFTRSTMALVLDSEFIDISSSTQEIGKLYHAVPFYDRVVLFAEKMQFSVQSEGELTAKSVSLQQTTAFDVNKKAVPIAVGNRIYFSFDRSGGFSGVQEYFINPNTILLDGLDISSNIPRYISGSSKLLIGSEIDNILLTLQDSTQNEVGVYKFFYSGDEKIQSAWSKFDFGSGNSVLFGFVVSGKIYFLIQRGSNYFFEVLDLDEIATTASTGTATIDPFRVHLDSLVSFNLVESANITDQGDYHATSTLVGIRVYSFATSGYVFKTSPAWSSGTKVSSSGYFKNPSEEVVINAGGKTYQGFRVYRNSVTNVLQFNSTGVVSSNEIMIKETTFDQGGVAQFGTIIYSGIPFNMNYKLSRPIIRSASGRGQSSVLDGRLQVRNGIVNFNDSLFFQIKVTPKYKDTYTYTYLYKMIPNYLGVSPTNLDYINFKQGSFKFPVFTNAEELEVVIENSTPYSCFLLSLEWEALYSARSKRIG